MNRTLDILFYNPSNQLHLDSFIDNPSQATIFEARRGFGVNELIKQAIKSITPQFVEITSATEAGAIGVDEVGAIKQFAKNKYTNKFFIIIPNAHNMTIEAQNTLLKNIEEPNMNIHYVLLSENNNILLPTIKSRSQIVRLDNTTAEQTKQLLIRNNVADVKKQTQIMIMASGLPHEIAKLISNKDYFEKRSKEITDAKTFVQGSLYDAILIINKYKNSRGEALGLLDDSIRLIEYTIQNSASENILNKIDPLLKAYNNISSNGNTRINLLSVVL